jgi:outer membrane protein TolC
MRRNIKISQVDYQQAIIAFRQRLHTALAEVENALSARKQYRLQAEKLEATLESALRAEALYRLRYQAGAATLQTWLDAQENRRQAEINLAENRFNQLQNHIELVKALGGDLSLEHNEVIPPKKHKGAFGQQEKNGLLLYSRPGGGQQA